MPSELSMTTVECKKNWSVSERIFVFVSLWIIKGHQIDRTGDSIIINLGSCETGNSFIIQLFVREKIVIGHGHLFLPYFGNIIPRFEI